MMLLMMHQPHLHQPWRLDRCNPFIHSFIYCLSCTEQLSGDVSEHYSFCQLTTYPDPLRRQLRFFLYMAPANIDRYAFAGVKTEAVSQRVLL